MYKGIHACFFWKVFQKMSRRDFFQLFCMFYLPLINRKCAKEKKTSISNVIPELKTEPEFTSNQLSVPHMLCITFSNPIHKCCLYKNIAKGTTDPRVEFISQVQTQILTKFHLQNLDQASTSKSQRNISLSTKLKLQNLGQTYLQNIDKDSTS